MRCPALAGLLALTLLACAPPRIPFKLRPAGSGPRMFANQEVRFERPGHPDERLLTTVENDGSTLTVVVAAPMGATLFVITVRDGQVALDPRVPLPASLDPSLLPMLIQITDWPLDEARAGLGAGYDLREAGAERILSRRGRELLRLTREGSGPPYPRVILVCPPLELRATITTLEE